MAPDCFFVNIPKTAGTSIRNALLYEKYPHRHMPAALAIAELGQDAWDELFTFSFIRNPWDRVVSQYHSRLQKEPHTLWVHAEDIAPDAPVVEFGAWVRVIYGGGIRGSWAFRPQFDWLCVDGQRVVEFVGAYETLLMDFDYVCGRLLIPRQALPRFKQSEHGPWRDYYDSATANIVADYFAKDIEFGGYDDRM